MSRSNVGKIIRAYFLYKLAVLGAGKEIAQNKTRFPFFH